ncbi:phosphotransferase [Hydrogenophaga sp. 5NK40-0174]|uniref:aminoglycoside phosphotransferase family protein n=1 Tax=Hydrogenophaga sp. 5NK40-0174 TaxID=3127649 RepID=UPI0031041235
MSSHPQPTVAWSDPARLQAFETWLNGLKTAYSLDPASLRPASADASFRRYLRLDNASGQSFVVMDAPPEKEDCAPFVRVAGLLKEAGLLVPDIMDWDQVNGFMLLTDLGQHTMMEQIDPANPGANHERYLQAVDTLLAWQAASKPGVLPAYDESLMRRELDLFPQWYLQQHKGLALSEAQSQTLEKTFGTIVERCLAMPKAYVHRDFMPRNLMIPHAPPLHGSLPPEGADPAWGGPASDRLMIPHARPLHGSLPPEGADPAWGGPAPDRLMIPHARPLHGSLPPEGASFTLGRPGGKTVAPRAPVVAGSTPATQLGVLDFQDAVYGPVTYDIASLMRDAFLTWEEDFVIDITVRYWEKARKAGLMDFEDWHADFGAFYRAVEWMGIQRHLKVAGIFARLTLRDGKPKYLADAPRFIDYIRSTAHRYRELTPLLRLIDDIEGFQAASGFAFGRV